LQGQARTAQQRRMREIGMVIREQAEFDHGATVPQAVSRFHASRAEGTRRDHDAENSANNLRMACGVFAFTCEGFAGG